MTDQNQWKAPIAPDEKPWYTSRTIWASLIVVFFSAYRLFTGNLISEADQNTAFQNVYQLVMLLSGMGAWYGRWSSDTKISNKVI